ncbi:hypothetical protein GGX14DRAFT_410651 [Mycena pura]|uniref:Uncharacterized protein n=1 Tax=Mycena pura TaxID=153505 RepID=A0AAD6YV61_9AGAR|nr:hypothetical protein GGX14DRAFT_410651 [Mycena pura]
MPALDDFSGQFEGANHQPTPGTAPVLPPELVCHIFEMTAQFPRNAVNLVLVSRRTQIWIERLIYDTVTLSDRELCSKFLRTLDSRPAQFFADNVKSLCIPGDIQLLEAKRVLAACQGVVNLAIWLPLHAAPLFPCVSALRPRRLSINVHGLYGMGREPDFTHPFFSKVTHLELVDWFDLTTCLTLDYLAPHLTHLALDVDVVEGATTRLRDVLASCRSLVLCLGLVTDDDTMIVASDQLAVIDDPRLVILSESDVVENWEASLRGTDASVWAFAEDIVAARMS